LFEIKTKRNFLENSHLNAGSQKHCMLIPHSRVHQLLNDHNITVTGALHVGAHECEELDFYKILGVSPAQVVWIDAIPKKVEEARARGIPNVHHAVITDKDGDLVTFHVASNGQSSSVLEFGTHAQEHPWVTFVEDIVQTSTTLRSFAAAHAIDMPKHNFWNLDIQGAELMALAGAGDLLQTADAIYCEVNEKELYKGCGLLGDLDALLATYQFKRVATEMTVHGWGDALYVR
jgi:FkbM family methyltransferase